ncbi:MAG: acetate/propionate family kinase [Frankiaceae bacterium]|nr:acetate/propionate family kinase [Frankiaceae bacterium]
MGLADAEEAAVLALNSGSSSLKARIRLGPDAPPALSVHAERLGEDGLLHASGRPDRPLRGGLPEAIEAVASLLGEAGIEPRAVAHRVVHGGPDHHRPTVVDEALLADLRAATPLAPLHQPIALRAIEIGRARWPAAAHIACFDTGFFADLPPRARRLPVAAELAARGVRRYGFHGLSVQSALLSRPGLGDAVIAHLGSGCSVSAVGADGRPRWTTMSLTPTGGMMSAGRSGDLDPQIVLMLIERHGYDPARLSELLDRRSGLAGIADGRRDVRDLRAAADRGDADAALALAMFADAAAMAIAAAATTLDRWSALVFTGGVGEHDAETRERICARLRLDGVEVLISPADEERVMDRQARLLLAEAS